MSRGVRPGVCGEAPDPGNEPGDGWLVRGDDQGSDGLNPARGVGDADPSGGSSSGWRHQVAKNAAADLSAGPTPTTTQPGLRARSPRPRWAVLCRDS